MFGGRFSKFQERLRNIRLTRSKKQQFQKDNEQYVVDKVDEIKKAVRADGAVVRKRRPVGISEKEKKEVKDLSKGEGFVQDNSFSKKSSIKETKEEPLVLKKEDVSLEKANAEQNSLKDKVQEIEKKKPKLPRKKAISFSDDLKQKDDSLEKDNIDDENRYQYSSSKKKDISSLGQDIIYRIRDQFEEYLDEIEVLSGEVFLLEKSNENEVELKKVLALKERIHELIEEVNQIIQQYNLYRKANMVDMSTSLNDSVLADDIILYRELLDKEGQEKKFVKEYKMLDEFQLLYLRLQDIRDEVSLVDKKIVDKSMDYQQRDKKYYDLRQKMKIENEVLVKCDEEIQEKESYFKRLMERISKIDKEEYITCHLKGVDALLDSGIRYMGMIFLSPFSGLLPSIGIQTLVARKMVKEAYHQIHFEEEKNIRYSAVDYQFEISKNLNDIDFTSSLLSNTLSDVKNLREDFLLQYQSHIPGYEETLQKLEILENKLIHHQNKVEIIKKHLKKSQKINEDKMIRVRKLNQE